MSWRIGFLSLLIVAGCSKAPVASNDVDSKWETIAHVGSSGQDGQISVTIDQVPARIVSQDSDKVMVSLGRSGGEGRNTYMLNTGETQSIPITEKGEYTVTVSRSCILLVQKQVAPKG